MQLHQRIMAGNPYSSETGCAYQFYIQYGHLSGDHRLPRIVFNETFPNLFPWIYIFPVDFDQILIQRLHQMGLKLPHRNEYFRKEGSLLAKVVEMCNCIVVPWGSIGDTSTFLQIAFNYRRTDSMRCQHIANPGSNDAVYLPNMPGSHAVQYKSTSGLIMQHNNRPSSIYNHN